MEGKESYVSMEVIKSVKERYILVAAIDIVSSAGMRNIYPAKRCEKPVFPHNGEIQGHTIFMAPDS
jgi:hypothetical protein